MKIRPGAVHPLQNLEKKHLSKTNSMSYTNPYPRIRFKVQADNKGALHFERLPNYNL